MNLQNNYKCSAMKMFWQVCKSRIQQKAYLLAVWIRCKNESQGAFGCPCQFTLIQYGQLPRQDDLFPNLFIHSKRMENHKPSAQEPGAMSLHHTPGFFVRVSLNCRVAPDPPIVNVIPKFWRSECCHPVTWEGISSSLWEMWEQLLRRFPLLLTRYFPIADPPV